MKRKSESNLSRVINVTCPFFLPFDVHNETCFKCGSLCGGSSHLMVKWCFHMWHPHNVGIYVSLPLPSLSSKSVLFVCKFAAFLVPPSRFCVVVIHGIPQSQICIEQAARARLRTLLGIGTFFYLWSPPFPIK